MIKILFLIHDLGQGGAEKVLVNLVNNMDRKEFDISVIALFGGGVNEQYLKKDIHFHAVFPKIVPGNSKLMKLLPPRQLHELCVKEKYDIEVSYLEGPSARVISGCTNEKTKLVSWIHVEQHTLKALSSAFRSIEEARRCYERFDQTICVSKFVHDDFCDILKFRKPCCVLYNTVESDAIKKQAMDAPKEILDDGCIKLIGVGTLKKSKGFDRLFRIIKHLREEKLPVHLYLLGKGPLQSELESWIQENNMDSYITLLGYQSNPYKYVANCDLFVCSSFAEGFSTAATEALIVGTPVCTVDVSGMKEMLGENNQYGIVTENNEEALYNGIRDLIISPDKLEYYKSQAVIRGSDFSTIETVKKVEDMFFDLLRG